MSIAIELCVESVESALAAHKGGADRLELCCALREGGLTPSAGLIRAVRDAVPLPVFVLIRPRAGDFCYSDREFEIMRDDVRAAKDLGADGVVIGVLTRDGEVDIARTAELVSLARPLSVTFHRAFDVSRDLDRSLEDVVRAGADRVLTSGGQGSGIEGAAKLAELVKRAEGRITILGGGGIRISNAEDFIARTHVTEIHTSLRRAARPSEQARRSEIILSGNGDGAIHYVVSPEDVLRLRQAIDSISS